MYARLALACGEPSLTRLLRSVDAADLTFWQAFEQVEGPIGYGPLIRLATWLGWTQFDTSKIPAPEGLIEWVTAFVADPTLGQENEEELLSDEELKEKQAAVVGKKLMAIFGYPEANGDGDRQIERAPGSE